MLRMKGDAETPVVEPGQDPLVVVLDEHSADDGLDGSDKKRAIGPWPGLIPTGPITVVDARDADEEEEEEEDGEDADFFDDEEEEDDDLDDDMEDDDLEDDEFEDEEEEEEEEEEDDDF